jgi:hypothetical protein
MLRQLLGKTLKSQINEQLAKLPLHPGRMDVQVNLPCILIETLPADLCT